MGSNEVVDPPKETGNSFHPKGLTTQESLFKLHQAIQKELENQEKELYLADRVPCRSNTWFADAYHHYSPYTTFSWPCAAFLVIASVLLIVCYAQQDDVRYANIPFEIIIILLIVIGNLYLVGIDNRLRHRELLQKAKSLLSYLEDCITICNWKPQHYPQLNMPFSPCITLQWTYRDDELVNLHWSLLVAGDVIALRPGQIVPAKCRSLVEDSPLPELKFGDVFASSQEILQEHFSCPRIRKPLNPEDYVLLETPYIRNLRLALQQSRFRPLSFFDKERHIVMVRHLQQLIIPLLLIVLFSVNVLRYYYLSSYVGHWTEMMLILQIEAILPLLPLTFPLCWILLNSYGMTRLVALFTLAKHNQLCEAALDDLGEVPAAEPSMAINWSHIKEHFCKIIWGQEITLCRTSNLLHVFGSVTNLCCIDKKGILSWPNPTPEKVFFLKVGDSSGSGGITAASTKEDSDDSLHIYDADKEMENSESFPVKDERDLAFSDSQLRQNRNIGECYIDQGYLQESRVEVLDLTHNNQIPFKVQFDDPKWKRHINSIKPLGLAILLNTCNPETQDYYAQFSTHIACEALHNDVVVPVISRRCLCELARQMGFTDQALDIFQTQQHLSMFRHVQPEQARKDKLARSLPNSKVKFPFPHMVSVVLKELNTGMLQLMSQGTGDIILDSCSDFWDGQDLCPLNESDRKKILDFYHRTSLTSYCSAFSYRPLSSEISNDLSDVYLEIPADSGRLYSSLWSPSPPRNWDQPLDVRGKGMSRCLSSDSLLGHALLESDPINDAQSCFEIQCNQVFIGMVAMQYQARTDMVHLIEQLDKACVRFVHFSKENELRSRVFSEKMGLESGWNCHISLLSERTRSESGNSAKASKSSLIRKPPSTDDILSSVDGPRSPKLRSTLEAMRQLSFSAPSAINLDMTTVKFEEEISMHNVTIAETASDMSDTENSPRLAVPRDTVSPVSNLEEDSRDDITEALIHEHAPGGSTDDGLHPSRSPSHITESTEQSVPITFDMSNRAKLPKGVENIRPHLENIDNVPLLVSLFTDCTANATIEMIKIMQDYGEVVCCLGSSANCYNMPVFMQADASIAVEPLYPQLCETQSIFDSSPTNFPLPIEISHKMNSLACGVSFYRDEPVSIYHLIMEARHFTTAMRNCFHFFLACSLSLSLTIAFSCVLLLPPPISLSHVLVFILLYIPLLSVSLIALPLDTNIMTQATAKNTHIVTKQGVFSFIGYTIARFLPSIAIILLCFGLTLSAMCQDMQPDTEPICGPLFPTSNFNSTGHHDRWATKYVYSLTVSQNLAALMLCIYFVCISVTYIHPSHQLWKRSPFINKFWFISSSFILLFQVAYFMIDLKLRADQVRITRPGLHNVPAEVWIVSWIWPICLLAINEVVKKHKIRVDVRYQKRAHLEFGTKLGMNSPF